jgi:hypothetical protein
MRPPRGRDPCEASLAGLPLDAYTRGNCELHPSRFAALISGRTAYMVTATTSWMRHSVRRVISPASAATRFASRAALLRHAFWMTRSESRLSRARHHDTRERNRLSRLRLRIRASSRRALRYACVGRSRLGLHGRARITAIARPISVAVGQARLRTTTCGGAQALLRQPRNAQATLG